MHSLIEIYTRYQGQDETVVVRWCTECGSVVIDMDCDNRTYPGSVMQMKRPRIAR